MVVLKEHCSDIRYFLSHTVLSNRVNNLVRSCFSPYMYTSRTTYCVLLCVFVNDLEEKINKHACRWHRRHSRNLLIYYFKPFQCHTQLFIYRAQGRLNIKMSSYQYRNSHCGDKTILRSSYLHNGISYTGKTASGSRLSLCLQMSPACLPQARRDYKVRLFWVYSVMNDFGDIFTYRSPSFELADVILRDCENKSSWLG